MDQDFDKAMDSEFNTLDSYLESHESGASVNGDVENGGGEKTVTKKKRNRGCRFRCTWTVTRAMIARALLVVQVCVVINSLLKIEHDRILWWIVLGSTLLGLVETAIVLFWKGGHEWKWFCPPVLFYLASIVPLLWALSFDEIERLYSACGAPGGSSMSTNMTTAAPTSLPEDRSMLSQISHQIWMQTFLIVIILARWILPKGGLTYDEISNLLFVYFAIASDIMELNIFEIFDRNNFCGVDYGILYAIMGVWAASLLQFTFPLSAKKVKRGTRKRGDKLCAWFCETEIWGLALTIILQDGPFLAVRMYCLVNYELFSYEIIFFTAKNALVVLMQLFRITAVLLTRTGHRKERKKEQRLAPLVASSAATYSVAHVSGYDSLGSHRRVAGVNGVSNPALDT